VTVRTYWAWETTAMLCLLSSAPTGEERGGGILSLATRTACLNLL